MQLDIETGKTVAEWGFQKDGTDVAMKDLINDTKGAPLAMSIHKLSAQMHAVHACAVGSVKLPPRSVISLVVLQVRSWMTGTPFWAWAPTASCGGTRCAAARVPAPPPELPQPAEAGSGRRAGCDGSVLCAVQRVRDGVVQEMSSPTVQYAGGKDYARNTNFNCMATSGACLITQDSFQMMRVAQNICDCTHQIAATLQPCHARQLPDDAGCIVTVLIRLQQP
jgi:hypothetical protein